MCLSFTGDTIFIAVFIWPSKLQFEIQLDLKITTYVNEFVASLIFDMLPV